MVCFLFVLVFLKQPTLCYITCPSKFLFLCGIVEVNAKDMISGGALWELVRISRDCAREDIKILAKRTLSSSPTFQAELKRLRLNSG